MALIDDLEKLSSELKTHMSYIFDSRKKLEELVAKAEELINESGDAHFEIEMAVDDLKSAIQKLRGKG